MSVVQTVVRWGITAYSLVVSTRGDGDSSANSNPEYSHMATRALASAGEGGDQDRQVDSLADSLAKVTVGDSKATEGGAGRETTSVSSDLRIERDHTTPEDKSANKEPASHSKRDPSTILAETEVGPPNVESNLLQTGQVESSLTTASTREHKTNADPTQQGGGIAQAEAEPDEKSSSKTSTPELSRKHASHIKSELADDQSVSIKPVDEDQRPDVVVSKDPKSEGRLANEKSVPDANCVSPSTPTLGESRGIPKPEVKVLPRDVDLGSSLEAGVPRTSTTSGSQPQEPQSLPANQAVQTKYLQATSGQQHENTTNPIQAECGGADPGQEEPDHLTPKALTPALPKAAEQGDDADSPVNEFDRVKVEDSSDSEDAIQRKQLEETRAQRSPKIITNLPGQVESESSGNRSIPPTPCVKGHGDRYYFCSWIDWYYVDSSHNAYYEDDTLLHDALFAIHSDQFSIDQISYCFYDNRLLSQAPDGLFYPVQTRHQKSYFHTPSGLHYFDYRRNVSPVVTPEVPEIIPETESTVAPKTAPADLGCNSYGRIDQPKAENNHSTTSADVKLLWPGSCAISLSVIATPTFCIDKAVYWFDMDDLWCQAPGDAAYRVHTWQNDPSESFPDRKHYFRTPSSVCYFDYLWNVFSVVTPADSKGSTGCGRTDQPKAENNHSTTSANVKLFWPRSPGIDSGGLIPMTFSIGGAVYWFDMDDLWCQAPGDRPYRVHTWQTDPNESPVNMRHHFDTPSGVYYFDYRRNVFSHDRALFCASSSAIDVGGLLPMTFCIGGTVYWFDVDVLWCQSPGDKCYRVHTWQDDRTESLADRKHYFYTPSGLYYFDCRWNVFSNEGDLFCASPSAINPGGLLPVTRRIDGMVYWFDMDELWCQAPNNKCYRVHTWQSEPNESLVNRKHHFYACNSLYYLDECRNLYSEDGKLVCRCPSSLTTGELGIPSFQIGDAPFWLHKDGLLSRGDDDALCRVLAWPKDSCASDVKSDSLQTGLLTGVVSYSPTLSTSSPPSVSSTIDSCQIRSTPPLFPKPGNTRSAPIGPVRNINREKAQVQPVRRRGNKDHLVCPYCDKVCRRPIALKEHIRAHEKDKSQLCPFVDPGTGFACDTGFCTKQNMRRHFSIHRVGTLEEYLGLPPLPLRKKKETAASELSAPHNPYHRQPPPKKQ